MTHSRERVSTQQHNTVKRNPVVEALAEGLTPQRLSELGQEEDATVFRFFIGAEEEARQFLHQSRKKKRSKPHHTEKPPLDQLDQLQGPLFFSLTDIRKENDPHWIDEITRRYSLPDTELKLTPIPPDERRNWVIRQMVNFGAGLTWRWACGCQLTTDLKENSEELSPCGSDNCQRDPFLDSMTLFSAEE